MQTKVKPTKSKLSGTGLTVHNGGKHIGKKSEGFFVSNYKEISTTDTQSSWNVDNDNYSPAKNFRSYELEDDSLILQNSGGGGGGNGMEKRIENLERKTEQIQTEIFSISKSLSVMEERQKQYVSKSDFSDFETRITALINNLPKTDNIKQLIIESNKDQDIATKAHVASELKSLKLSSIKYFIATGLSIITVICGFIKLFM